MSNASGTSLSLFPCITFSLSLLLNFTHISHYSSFSFQHLPSTVPRVVTPSLSKALWAVTSPLYTSVGENTAVDSVANYSQGRSTFGVISRLNTAVNADHVTSYNTWLHLKQCVTSSQTKRDVIRSIAWRHLKDRVTSSQTFYCKMTTIR